MKNVLRIALWFASWAWGLYLLAFIAPRPILWPWLGGWITYAVLSALIPPGKEPVMATPIGFAVALYSLAYLGLFFYTWGAGWPQPHHSILVWLAILVSPIGRVIMAFHLPSSETIR